LKRYKKALSHISKCGQYDNTVKPVLRGHLRDKKWPYKTGDLFKEVH